MAERLIPVQASAEDVNRIEAVIDDYALDGRRHGAGPLRSVYERRFGQEGIGWRPQERSPTNQAEKLGQIMGLQILEIVVTPRGDELANSQPLMQRM